MSARKFTDNVGRQWQIEIGIGELAELKRILGGSIVDDPSLLERLAADTLLQAECLAAVVQRDETSINEFYAGLKMEGVIDGMVALFTSLADFATQEKGRIMLVAIEEFLKMRVEGKQKLQEMIDDGRLRELVAATYRRAVEQETSV